MSGLRFESMADMPSGMRELYARQARDRSGAAAPESGYAGGGCMKCKYEGNGVWEGRCVGTKEVDPCKGYEKCKSYRPDYQTNADRIRAMSDEELAKNNIRLSYQCDIDYDYEEEPYTDWMQCYKTSDGLTFYNKEAAVEYELSWLRQPAEGEGGEPRSAE